MPKSENNKQATFSSSSNKDKPRIDVVLQATGNHAWNMSDGWINTLRREGLLNRAFRPTANWGAEEPSNDDGLYEYLKNPQADLMLLLGFDWHSQPLHNTKKWRERWIDSSIIKIAVINEQCSAKPVQKNAQWRQEYSAVLDNSISCIDAIICNHEPDVAFLKKEKCSSKPIIFQPFAIDTEYFKSSIPFKERFNTAFFRGRIANFRDSGCYDNRKFLVEQLSQYEEVCLKGYEDDLTLEDYIKDLNQHKVLINLPSISLTLTARVFEALGCGGTLLQNHISGNDSNSLFKDWQHLVYFDFKDPDDLVFKLKYLIKNPDVAEEIARRGSELCHREHSIQARILHILKWVDNKFDIGEINPDSSSTSDINRNIPDTVETITKVSEEKIPTVVIDGVFFQLYKTGIDRLWRSLLEEWSKSGFARHIVVLDRGKTAPRIPGIRYRNIETYDYQKTGLDSQMLQFVCDEIESDLFISTYYTAPLSTPSVFMAYDMIPEVIGADLNEPMWKEKRNGILHASRYIAISENTARDLQKHYPSVANSSIVIAHCGVADYFFPASSHEVLNFRTKYGIQKPYFLLVGSRFGVDGYKNAIHFFRALKQLWQKDKIAVVCVGGKPVLEPELLELAGETPVDLLRLEDSELRAAYSGAVALVFPSLYEGFGLPIAEAMACGCPVITCRNSSIYEVAGEAAIYVDEYRTEEMVEALDKVLVPEARQVLIDRGLEQAKQLSWEKMATTIADFIKTTSGQIESERTNSTLLIWQELRIIQAQCQQTLYQQEIAVTQEEQIQEGQVEESSDQAQLQLQPQATVDYNDNLFQEELYQLSEKLHQKHRELRDSRSELSSMRSSKLWNLRTAWFNLKQILFPLICLILGLNLITLVNSVYTYWPLSEIVSWLSRANENFFLRLGISTLSIALMLGIIGNLRFIDPKILRIVRLVLVISGSIFIAIAIG